MTQHRLIGAVNQLRERQLLEPGYFIKTWTGRILMGIMVVGGVITLILILLDVSYYQWIHKGSPERTKRELIKKTDGIATLTVQEGNTTTLQVYVYSSHIEKDCRVWAV